VLQAGIILRKKAKKNTLYTTNNSIKNKWMFSSLVNSESESRGKNQEYVEPNLVCCHHWLSEDGYSMKFVNKTFFPQKWHQYRYWATSLTGRKSVMSTEIMYECDNATSDFVNSQNKT